jgi:hypothetical protein
VYSTTFAHNYPTSCYAYYYADPGAYDSSSTEEYHHHDSSELSGQADNIHAPQATFQTQNLSVQTLLDDNIWHDSVLAHDDSALSLHSTPQSFTPVPISSSLRGTALPQSDAGLTPFMLLTPSEQPADRASEDATNAVHELSADPTIKKKLRPNEIRQRRADRRKAKVLDISSVLSFPATDP